ncbi:hypothetical protein NA78x_001739 [Anatilimnocola sp. NA78]|uniref:hypothetical protein n=1 Tax=Anatilimnocola sp. NA78 TaxID=3415683 RepID=UPI003CE59809
MAKVHKSADLQPSPPQQDPLSKMMQLGPTKLEAPAEPPPATVKTVTEILVEVPIAPMPPSEFTVHIDMKLTPPQSTVARRIAAHLDRQQACLRNGQRITTPSAALKWLLEQIEHECSADRCDSAS